MQPLQIMINKGDGLNYVQLSRRPPVAVLGSSTWRIVMQRLRKLLG
ncbi:hypothetical protein [Simplicispira suum]|nr:hypothetical protein [Simplicispira suum]